MKRIVCMITTASMLSVTLFAQTSSENKLTEQEKKDGWTLLYDGKTTKGWHSYGKKTAGSSWTADNGAICFVTPKKTGATDNGGGDLVTSKEYGNFDLKLEWKISKAGNSGVIFYVKEDPKYKETWNTGLETQVLDNDGHSDGKIKKHRAGDLYDLISSSSEPVKPVGEWNQVEIKSYMGKLDFYLNGVHIVSTTLWDNAWWTLVKGSKFKDMPGFSKYKLGRIALQDHECDVCFRNIKIKELK